MTDAVEPSEEFPILYALLTAAAGLESNGNKKPLTASYAASIRRQQTRAASGDPDLVEPDSSTPDESAFPLLLLRLTRPPDTCLIQPDPMGRRAPRYGYGNSIKSELDTTDEDSDQLPSSTTEEEFSSDAEASRKKRRRMSQTFSRIPEPGSSSSEELEMPHLEPMVSTTSTSMSSSQASAPREPTLVLVTTSDRERSVSRSPPTLVPFHEIPIPVPHARKPNKFFKLGQPRNLSFRSKSKTKFTKKSQIAKRKPNINRLHHKIPVNSNTVNVTVKPSPPPAEKTQPQPKQMHLLKIFRRRNSTPEVHLEKIPGREQTRTSVTDLPPTTTPSVSYQYKVSAYEKDKDSPAPGDDITSKNKPFSSFKPLTDFLELNAPSSESEREWALEDLDVEKKDYLLLPLDIEVVGEDGHSPIPRYPVYQHQGQRQRRQRHSEGTSTTTHDCRSDDCSISPELTRMGDKPQSFTRRKILKKRPIPIPISRRSSSSESIVEIDTIPCAHCKKVFGSMSQLVQHSTREHSGSGATFSAGIEPEC